jgi:hypothetical protein
VQEDSAAELAGVEVPIVWRGRRVRAFVPRLLVDRDVPLDQAPVARTAVAAAEVGHAAADMPADYEALARLLLRAEGVASSNIEGVSAPVVDIVLAEQDPAGSHTPAAWVAANLQAVTEAIATAPTTPLSIELLCQWHRTLMTGSPSPARYVGVLRAEQGWIGGTSPLDAHLVTPPPERLAGLLADLVHYVNRDDVDPVAQAGVAHAQFELIHPFGDGNGRVGRVLVAWILTRRLSLITPPPVSIGIAADVGGYSAGLALFRLGRPDPWVRWFADTVSGAARSQSALVAEVEALKQQWRRQLGPPRPGPPRPGPPRLRRALRSDAAAWRVIDLLPRHLVLTSQLVAGELALTTKAATDALHKLAAAAVRVEHGTLARPVRGRPPQLYVSSELLGLAGSSPLR